MNCKCDLCENSCEYKLLDAKIKKLAKNILNYQTLQDNVNKRIFDLLKESGVDIENTFKNYYALNEDDYTKTLTSEDDINTLEPGTYKIVKTDMPQNAPTGIESSEYDGTLIMSNSYAILSEYGHLHIGDLLPTTNKFHWIDVITSRFINTYLKYYMMISKYKKGYIKDIHILNHNYTGVYIVNSTTQNLPVQQNGIIIARVGTATNSLFITFIPEDSFDVYYCAKKADGTWTEWGQVAFMSDVPSLEGYATQEWVNQQIQDITEGSVTADWVKNNYYALTNSQYKTIPENTDYNTLGAGCYFGLASNFTNDTISSLNGLLLIIKFNSSSGGYRGIVYNLTNDTIFYCMGNSQVKRIAFFNDIPSLSGYATQSWVQENFQPK